MKGRVLVTDAQQHSVLAALRCLAAAGYEVTVVASRRTAPGLWSRSCSERAILPDPRLSVEGFIAGVERLLTSRRHDVLLPGSDQTLLAISRYRDRLSELVELGLPDEGVVRQVLDKRWLTRAAQAVGFPVPEAHQVEEPTQALSAARSLGYPVLVKPVPTVIDLDGHMLRRAGRLVGDGEALLSALAEHGPSLIQRRLEGKLLSFGGVATPAGLHGFVVSQYLRTWPPEAGNASCSITIEAPPGLPERVERLVATLGWTGIFELELLELDDGTLAPIDFNPRVYGSISLAAAAGVPLAALWCDVLTGTAGEAPHAIPGIRYRWEDAEFKHMVWQARHGGGRAAREVLERHDHVQRAFFEPRDPLPSIARLADLTSTAARRLTHK
jgi:predicted ATP-grasp superfamily ATP-dependent carboligase